MDGDVPRRPSNGVYISQLIRFAIVCSHVNDIYARNKMFLVLNFSNRVSYRYHKLRKAFFLVLYRRHHELISKFNVGLKELSCKPNNQLNVLYHFGNSE